MDLVPIWYNVRHLSKVFISAISIHDSDLEVHDSDLEVKITDLEFKC